MNREFAINASQSIFDALKKLHSVALGMEHLNFLEKPEYEKSLGIIIGQIQVQLLEPIIAHFPDLDDLKDLR